jgi:nucleotide-binding universal stress UspA family protein
MTRSDTLSRVFERVLCGVDDSEAGRVAARLAARVAAPGGTLVLVSVEDTALAVHSGWASGAVLADLHDEATRALERARSEAEPLHAVEAHAVTGEPAAALLAEAARLEATLVAVGSHDHRRGLGIALGSIATRIIHDAPCSVLLARPERDQEAWPGAITVALDGSVVSSRAAAAAWALGERLDVPVRAVLATDGHADLAEALRIAPGLEELPGKPVDALLKASEETDLLVLGSRGLHGLKALGSVSERVGHRARCTVLVVREPV